MIWSAQTDQIRNTIFFFLFSIVRSGRNLPRSCTRSPPRSGQLTFSCLVRREEEICQRGNTTTMLHGASLQFRMHHFHLDQGEGENPQTPDLKAVCLSSDPERNQTPLAERSPVFLIPLDLFASSQTDEGNLSIKIFKAPLDRLGATGSHVVTLSGYLIKWAHSDL